MYITAGTMHRRLTWCEPTWRPNIEYIATILAVVKNRVRNGRIISLDGVGVSGDSDYLVVVIEEAAKIVLIAPG